MGKGRAGGVIDFWAQRPEFGRDLMYVVETLARGYDFSRDDTMAFVDKWEDISPAPSDGVESTMIWQRVGDDYRMLTLTLNTLWEEGFWSEAVDGFYAFVSYMIERHGPKIQWTTIQMGLARTITHYSCDEWGRRVD